MSKEFAQTFAGKRMVWLIAILAAGIVLASVGSQWRSASALLPATTVTLTQSPAAGTTGLYPGTPITFTMTTTTTGANTLGPVVMTINLPGGVSSPPVSGVTCPATGTGGTGITWTAAVSGTTVTCTSSAILTAGMSGAVMAVTAYLDGTAVGTATGTVVDGSGVYVNAVPDSSVGPVTIDPLSLTITASPVAARNANGLLHTVTFTFSGTSLCRSQTPPTFPNCASTDVLLTGGTLLAITNNGPILKTATVTFYSNTASVATVQLKGVSAPTSGTNFLSSVANKTYVKAYIAHIDSAGNVVARRDVTNNVRGARHTICAVDANGNGILIPLTNANNVLIQAGGGATSINDPNPTFTDPQFFTQTVGASSASCFSYISTEAGDQEITVQYPSADGLTFIQVGANVATDNKALIKEWNVLENSCINIAGTVARNADGSCNQNPTRTLSLAQDPVKGWVYFGTDDGFLFTNGVLDIHDAFIGSHVDRTGAVVRGPLTGVIYKATLSGCGSIGTVSGITDTEINPTDTAPDIDFDVAGCSPGASAVITITGSEPSPLGSGTGRTVTETITLNFTAPIAHKSIMLAWAGQRIVLEHDWRLPAGDLTNGTPAGICPFDSLKQGGVTPRSSDSQQHDVPNDPQGACISRVLFESEQPGQVDVEAFCSPPATGSEVGSITYIKGGGPGNFLTGLNAVLNGSDQASVPFSTGESCNNAINVTKIAFVIYYMKLEHVNVSLVSQVTKPTHNGNLHGWNADLSTADYSPGNPWDASKDAATNAVDWNVSTDLLARIRVTGWFLNENPSGRPADTTNPLNVLPANRWVMPADWAILAGGPADNADGSPAIGTAEQFRPYYDIMFGPNNKAGITLLSPTGVAGVAVGIAVNAPSTGVPFSGWVAGVAGVGSATNPMIVTGSSQITAGVSISADACVTLRTVVANLGGVLIVSPAFLAAPAQGTPIYVCTGVPFEGPMSLIDIPGLASGNGGVAGAALSNILGTTNSVTRDTILADGDVNWWDAPMPPAPVTVSIRGAGYLKQVYKADVYYNGTANTSAQNYPNPFYLSNIPDSPFIPAIVVGGGYYWDSWGSDGPQAAGGFASSFPPGTGGQGPYWFWKPVRVNVAPDTGMTLDPLLGSGLKAGELAYIGTANGDTVGRDFTLYTDNHGEAMVTANGDFNTDLTACAANALGGGRHCKPGDTVGTGTITATADYPDFRGKHPPILSNTATVTWKWGGYKDVTIEPGETPQFKYIVFHGVDRDGFCNAAGIGAISLHPVLSGAANDAWTITDALGNKLINPAETVDFLIDSGQGIILGTSGGGTLNAAGNRQFATGVTTFSTALNTAIKEFPLSPLAAAGATDECQAWIRISNSLLGVTDVLAVAHDDEGDIGFDRIVDLQNTATYTLNFRWSLITWNGADNIPVADALKATGANASGTAIFDQVTAVYGWDAAAQSWLGFFPAGVNVPGANDLVALKKGSAYWIAITGPSSVSWTIATSVL